MALNFPGPNEIRLNYAVDDGSGFVLQHQMRMNFISVVTPNPGDAFADVDVVPRVIAARALSLVVDELVTLMQPFYTAANTVITSCELWKYAFGTFDATFISEYAINAVGTGVGSEQMAGQDIFTFRTYEGVIMKNVMMENFGSVGPSVPYTGLNAINTSWVNFFINDNDSWFVARDTS